MWFSRSGPSDSTGTIRNISGGAACGLSTDRRNHCARSTASSSLSRADLPFCPTRSPGTLPILRCHSRRLCQPAHPELVIDRSVTSSLISSRDASKDFGDVFVVLIVGPILVGATSHRRGTAACRVEVHHADRRRDNPVRGKNNASGLHRTSSRCRQV